MRLALLFSGQGGQGPQHLARVAQLTPPALRPTLKLALPFLDEPESVEVERLQENRYAQPLIFALQVGFWDQLRQHLPRPICAAGYSLGEMAATSTAGLFAPETGISLCARRAQLMDAATPGASGMLAVLGLGDDTLARISSQYGLAIAIRNGPGHRVLAGAAEQMDQAEQACLAAGASRTVRLAVRTPSHTAQLQTASVAFGEALSSCGEGRLAFPVLSAIDGRPAHTRAQARDALARQISTPLDWEACMQTLVEMQPDVVLEIGPCNALARLLNEIAPHLPVRACDDFRSIEGIVDWLRSLS